jgi:hypothetical protein
MLTLHRCPFRSLDNFASKMPPKKEKKDQFTGDQGTLPSPHVPQLAPVSSKLTTLVASELILDYLTKQNRPYSVIGIIFAGDCPLERSDLLR